MTTPKTDVIVIGSGLGGLSCALHLAKRGLRVTVLEKQPKIGGYAQNFVRSGFDFDVSLHVFPAMNETGGMYRILDYLQVLNKLEFTERHPMFVSAYNDDTYALRGGVDAANYLKDRFPKQSAGIDRFLSIVGNIIRDNTQLFWTGKFDADNFFPSRYFKKTYQDLLNDCIDDPRLSGLMGQLWQSTGLPNSACAANWSAEVMGMHLLTGNYYVKGGGQRISNAMAHTLNEAGCTVRTGCLVNRIIVKNKQVCGVELESGETIPCNIVAANTSPQQAYLELIGKEFLTKPFIYKMGTLVPSCSLLTLYLGLDCAGKDAGVTDHTTFVNADYSTERAYRDAMTGAHHITDYVISDYTDPSSGSHPTTGGIVQILEVADGRQWTDIGHAAYREKKQQVTETILDKVTKRYPHLKQHIKVCEMGTPRTMALATRNPLGSVYGFAQTPEQADNWRFGVAGLFKGLFFTGAWPRGGGGGYMGAIVNGRVAATQIIMRYAADATEKTFDVASPHKPPPHQHESTMPQAPAQYVTVAEPDDLSSDGEMRPDACVKIFSRTAQRYIDDHRPTLAAIWTGMNRDDDWHARFFQLRSVFVPEIFIKPGTRLRVQISFTPLAEGKGEVIQDIFVDATDKKLANSGGRVRIRVKHPAPH